MSIWSQLLEVNLGSQRLKPTELPLGGGGVIMLKALLWTTVFWEWHTLCTLKIYCVNFEEEVHCSYYKRLNFRPFQTLHIFPVDLKSRPSWPIPLCRSIYFWTYSCPKAEILIISCQSINQSIMVKTRYMYI